MIVRKRGKSAVATIVEWHSRFLTMLWLSEGKKAAGLADAFIDRVNGLPGVNA